MISPELEGYCVALTYLDGLPSSQGENIAREQKTLMNLEHTRMKRLAGHLGTSFVLWYMHLGPLHQVRCGQNTVMKYCNVYDRVMVYIRRAAKRAKSSYVPYYLRTVMSGRGGSWLSNTDNKLCKSKRKLQCSVMAAQGTIGIF